MVKPNFEPKPLKGPMYAMLYPFLATRAQECGYALSLHGTLGNDLDIIAVPWTDAASSAEDLVANILKWSDDVIEIHADDVNNGKEGVKPHGRRCWTLHLMARVGAYIDLSVMPLQPGALRVAWLVESEEPKYHYWVSGNPWGESTMTTDAGKATKFETEFRAQREVAAIMKDPILGPQYPNLKVVEHAWGPG